MQSLTNAVPKPLVSLAGRPLLDRVLDRLAEAGIGKAVVNVHYLGGLIEDHLASRALPEIVISDESEAVLDTGGGVRKALPVLGRGPFLVHNSDSVWSEGRSSNLKMLMNAWQPEQMDALLLIAHRDSSIGYGGRGDFSLDREGRLERRPSSASVPFVFAGVSILKPELFEGIEEQAFSLNLIFDRAIANGRLSGCVLEGVWMHVGTPAALREAEDHLNAFEGGVQR